MNKLLTRLGVAGALTAATVWAVKNQDKIEQKLVAGVEKAKTLGDKGLVKAVGLVDGALTKANNWLSAQEPEAEKPKDEYTNPGPLLDDGDGRA